MSIHNNFLQLHLRRRARAKKKGALSRAATPTCGAGPLQRRRRSAQDGPCGSVLPSPSGAGSKGTPIWEGRGQVRRVHAVGENHCALPSTATAAGALAALVMVGLGVAALCCAVLPQLGLTGHCVGRQGGTLAARVKRGKRAPRPRLFGTPLPARARASAWRTSRVKTWFKSIACLPLTAETAETQHE